MLAPLSLRRRGRRERKEGVTWPYCALTDSRCPSPRTYVHVAVCVSGCRRQRVIAHLFQRIGHVSCAPSRDVDCRPAPSATRHVSRLDRATSGPAHCPARLQCRPGPRPRSTRSAGWPSPGYRHKTTTDFSLFYCTAPCNLGQSA